MRVRFFIGDLLAMDSISTPTAHVHVPRIGEKVTIDYQGRVMSWRVGDVEVRYLTTSTDAPDVNLKLEALR